MAKPLELQFGFKSHQDVEILNQLRDDAISKLNILKSRAKPQTNQEKLQEIQVINGDWGTHSILDIYQVTQQPDFGSISPLPPEQLVQFFGTKKPSRKMIEDFIEDFNNIDQVDSLRDRYEGIYIILYSEGKPDEIWFYGYSGD